MTDSSSPTESIRTALRRHSVALISLAVALTGLGYNTWRNETTEAHRNTREAAFRILQELGELQQVLDRRFFGGDHSEPTRIVVWGKFALVRDLSVLVSADTEREAEEAFIAWGELSKAFDSGDSAAERAISSAVRETRTQVLNDLRALD